jgi:hypothetical protein
VKTVPISAIRSDHLEAAKQFLEIPEKEKPLSTWMLYETIAEVWEDHSIEALPPVIIRPTPAPFRLIGPAEIEVWHPTLFPVKKKILLWEYFVTLDLADAHRVPVIVGTMDQPMVPYKSPGPEVDEDAYKAALSTLNQALGSANSPAAQAEAAFMKQKQMEAAAAKLKKSIYGDAEVTFGGGIGGTAASSFVYTGPMMATMAQNPKPVPPKKLKPYPLSPYGGKLPPDNFDPEEF